MTNNAMEMETEIEAIHDELLYLSIALGAWGESRHKSNLDTIAAAAKLIAIAARRIEQLAEGEKRP